MKQEYVLVSIIGLFLTAYVLEAVVQPLTVDLVTPYHYLSVETFSNYPFTTAVIFIRAFAVWLTPVWLFSFFNRRYGLKSALALVLAALTQLYVLQELATGNKILPLEWALALALGGLGLIPMIPYYIVRGGITTAYDKFNKAADTEEEDDSE